MASRTSEQNVQPGRLFVGSCFALIATSIAFAMVGAIMGPLKERFVLTNEQVGWIGGAALWGFTISIFILGPLVDLMGMRFQLRLACAAHAVGTLLMIAANGFWMLFCGALVIALGNGTVEAVCNPLVATVYPDRKTEKLNQFHVWFPGGIVIGGLIAYGLDRVPALGVWLDRTIGLELWQLKLAVILLPTLVYAVLFTGRRFPATERVASGVSGGEMVKATLLRPLFIVLFFCMMLTASVELGPNRWVTAVLEAGGIAGILVLVWISGLMAVLRFFAGPIVHRLSPTGILFVSAILSGLGLLWLSFAETTSVAFAAATVFAAGVCYFWPTMLGVASERVPKGGALALALLGGIGMASVGLVTSPVMGRIADKHVYANLPVDRTLACMDTVLETYPELKASAKPDAAAGIQAVVEEAARVRDAAAKAGQGLGYPKAAEALRMAMAAAPDSDAARLAKEIVGPADNAGGRMSFRCVAPLSLLLAVVFGILYFRDRAAGGYQVERIAAQDSQEL